MCIFHRYGKWRQYEVHVPARPLTKNWGLCAAIEYRQKRFAKNAGK